MFIETKYNNYQSQKPCYFHPNINEWIYHLIEFKSVIQLTNHKV